MISYKNIIGGAVLLVGIFSLWSLGGTSSKVASVKICTMDVQLCSDGSYVSRTGPNCEFSQCPISDTAGTVAIGSQVIIGSTTIGVLELIEDSRCPIDVQCIQAGTVRVRASIDSYNKDFTFKLLEPQVVGNVTITLVSVIPAQKKSTQTITPSDYRFSFTVVQSTTPKN